MKILQVANHFYPHHGGIERFVLGFSRELVRKGHEVTVICSDDPVVGDSIVDGIRVKRLPVAGKISNTNITLSLFSQILREDCDVVHTHLPFPWNASISAIASALRRKPLFLTYHNDIRGNGLHGCLAQTYNYSALQILLRRSVKIFIHHEDYLRSSRFLKKYSKKVVVAMPGIDTECFKPLDVPEKGKNAIFFLSILDKQHEYKGLMYLLESVKQLAAAMPIKLFVGGTGDLLLFYKKFISENNLENFVSFLGPMKDEDIVKYYNTCDVFVLPSTSPAEGFGLVALEAMACKKPVIVTEYIGVAPDIRAAKAGMVVESKNSSALSQALQYILTNKSEAEAMGRRAYELVTQKYTWRCCADIIENEYKKFI